MKYSKSLLALIGLGALVYWRYKKATPEEKKKVKDVMDMAKNQLNHLGTALKSKAEDMKEEASLMVNSLKDEANEMKGKVEKTFQEGGQSSTQKGNMGHLPGTTQGNPTT